MNTSAIRQKLRVLARIDVTMVVLMSLLLVAGCIFIYGVGQKAGGKFTDYWGLQVRWAGLGTVCFIVLCCSDYSLLGRWSWLIYAASIVLLVLVWFFGWTANDARSWLKLPIVNRVIQPAEFAKPATILLGAWLASRPSLRVRRGQFVVPVLFVMSVPVVLICLQPDWGTALVFIPVICAIVLVAGLPWKWALVTMLLAVASA